MSVRRRISGSARFIVTEDEYELRHAQNFARAIEESAEFDLSALAVTGYSETEIHDDWELPFPATLFHGSFTDSQKQSTNRGALILDRDHDLNPFDGWLYCIGFHMRADSATISIPWTARILKGEIEYFPTKSLQERPGYGETFTAEVVVESELGPACYALHMLSCKNVEIERVEPSRQERRERERKGHLRPNEYRIIVRLPGKKSYTVAGPKRIGDPEVTPHMVRGHFSEYTESGRLFGKYVGRYWIPAHIRGKREENDDVQPRDYVVVSQDPA